MITYDRSTPVQVVNAAYDIAGNSGRKIVRLSNGWFVALVRSTVGAPYYSGYFYVSKDNGATWSLLTTIGGTGAPNYGLYQPFAITAFGNYIHCIFGKGSDNTKILYVKFDATTISSTINFNTTVTLDTLGAGSFDGCSIECDSSGNPHAVWSGIYTGSYPNSKNIRYSKSSNGGTSWDTPTNITTTNTTNQNNVNPSIIINGSGNPVILFEYRKTDVTTSYKIQSVRYTTSWQAVVTVYDGTTYDQSNPCATVDGGGNIHVTWQGRDSTDNSYNNIRHTKSTDGGASWAAHTKATTGNTVARITPSVACDDSNQPFIAYNENGTLKFTYYTSSWQTPETIGTGTNPSVCEFSRFSKPVTLFMGASDVKIYGIWYGLTFDKELTAYATTTVSLVKVRTFFKTLIAYGVARGSVSKNVNKFLTAFGSVTGRLKKALPYFKPLYPILTVTEYPIEMSVTEYPITLEVLGMPKAGSTITLKGTFPDIAGNLTLLADVAVKVYGPGKVLLTTISGASVTEVSTGIYTVEYTIPADTIGQFDYEFSGTLGSKTIIGRSSFDSIWK
jgi:hypothetical protein